LDAVGLAFKPDGTKMYVLNSGTASDAVFQYSLATAWDVFTASYDSISFSVAGQETAPIGITFKPDGTKMYIVGTVGDDVNEYNLGTAWNVSTATYVQNFSVATQAGALPYKVEFSDDGTKMFIASGTNDTIFQYTLSSAWDISTASYSSVSYDINSVTGEGTLFSFTFADSGNKMYIAGDAIDAAYGFVLDTAFDLSSVRAYYKYLGAQEASPTSVTFKPDGSEFYVLGFSGDDVNQYSVSGAWQVDTTTYTRAFVVSGQTGTTPAKARFKDDGTRMYVLSNTNDFIYQYNLSTAWDISTASYASISFSVSSQESNPWGMCFGDSGSKLYVVGTTADTVFQYTLSTPWNLSTASYASLSKNVSAQETTPMGVFVGKNGTKMYIVGETSDAVHQYDLSSAWDVSTATYVSSFNFSIYGTQPRDVTFKNDGSTFYVVNIPPAGDSRQLVYQFTIS
jgi:sugar lactone lactonase YvrE